MTTSEKIFQLLGSIDARLDSGDSKFKDLKEQIDDIHQSVCHDLTKRVSGLEATHSSHKIWLQWGWKIAVVLLTTIGGYFGWTSGK